ncbi:MAG TPA: UbiA family prenyltransferase [Candidatus Thermoplasmatota archaeon]|nr:UbiA family prenyltransferase [Candidatus Thermoplasmatota archaeon]
MRTLTDPARAMVQTLDPAPPPRLLIGEAALALWRLARPEIWLVSLVPMVVGHLLATREIAPGFGAWLAFWSRASTEGATTSEFLATLVGWLQDAWPFLLAAVVMGPLVWLATLLVNDVHDLAGDRLNPRKARSPLVQGIVTAGWARATARLAGASALALALLVNVEFAALVAGALALAWAYSAPPLRLKTRPGADVLVNAMGVGGLAGLAGWSVARPLAEAPWLFMPQALLVAAAVYVPTTLVDYDADVRAGYATFATKLGRDRAYRVGFACWVAANLGALGFAWTGTIIPRAMFPLLAIFAPLLVWQYHTFIGHARDGPEMVKGIVLASLTFLAVNLVFALMYTGLWRG